jgi:hypothetical protein
LAKVITASSISRSALKLAKAIATSEAGIQI